ncbi:hypothetical protein Vadar_007996 [Vaccinium darrowii]|uniref:Uncharacterized protein n=1 Tax=Vaccinium darrowii TaxID=229202 RepID=A0ACB7XNZ8_9ERIC|nr:hypothetical protein Vadar_007996 [Vaccinium darrowii]
MVQTLEAIKGGGGSIKVGTTGKISALMSRELEPAKATPQTPVSSRDKSLTDSNVVANDPITPRRLKPRTATDEASSSGSSSTVNKKSPEIVRKTKHHNRKTHQVPMLNSDNISVDGTPIRGKPDKRRSYNIVEVVDIKCGSPDKAWAGPITNRLKKLSFSKLSESVV